MLLFEEHSLIFIIEVICHIRLDPSISFHPHFIYTHPPFNARKSVSQESHDYVICSPLTLRKRQLIHVCQHLIAMYPIFALFLALLL